VPGAASNPAVAERPHILREYALMADGERGALVGPDGEIAWLCFPSWADPAVFASLVGGGGTYAIHPRGPHVWGGHYESGGLIWRNRWITQEGVVECREALAFPGKRERAVLIRRVEAVKGPAHVRVRCLPAGEYGQRPVRLRRDEEGVWRGRLGGAPVAWHGASHAKADSDGTLILDLEIEEGDGHDLILVLGPGGDEPVDPALIWEETASSWHLAAPGLRGALARRDATHAWAVLRGLTSSHGATVAAATMSLPERARAGRAYDYRYAWIRDQAMIGQAAAVAGAFDLVDAATRFLTERVLEHGPKLAPAYTVDGSAIPGERRLKLPGYPGGSDIVGNRAGAQFQLDGFGEALLCLATADEQDRADADTWQAIETAAAAIEERWRDPDAGIWEIEERHWTHSLLACAAGLRKIASRPTAGARAGGWLALADRLIAETGGAVRPSGAWKRAPDDDRVDAALLFGPLRGAVPLEDPRAKATLEAVLEELCSEHFTYRYRHDARPLGDAEGAFLLCGFTVALTLHGYGRHVEAAHYFERSRSACGPPGLFAEEYDVTQRQLRGNLPQAFVHALLMEAAVVLAEDR
jgi:GH15 family glucan-1,4-alpha-glucosidase